MNNTTEELINDTGPMIIDKLRDVEEVEEVTGSLVHRLKLSQRHVFMGHDYERRDEAVHHGEQVDNMKYHRPTSSAMEVERNDGDTSAVHKHAGGIQHHNRESVTRLSIHPRGGLATLGNGTAMNMNKNVGSSGEESISNTSLTGINVVTEGSSSASASNVSSQTPALQPLQSNISSIQNIGLRREESRRDAERDRLYRRSTAHTNGNFKSQYKEDFPIDGLGLPYPIDNTSLTSGSPHNPDVAVVSNFPLPPVDERPELSMIQKRTWQQKSNYQHKTKSVTPQDLPSSRQNHHRHHHRRKAPGNHPTSKESSDQPQSLPRLTKDRKKLDNDSKESSDNGSDSGYAGSTSSNDAFGNTTSESSSSDTCSSRKQKCPAKTSSKRKLKNETHHNDPMKRDSSCSSEIADFSSEGSVQSSPRVLSFGGPLSEDSSEGSGNESSNRQDMLTYSEELVKAHEETLTKSAEEASQFASATSSNNASASSFPRSYPASKRNHRRWPARSSRRRASPGTKTTGLGNGHDKRGDPQNTEKEQRKTYALPDTWSFVERQLKRKMSFEDILRKKTYEEQCKELHANFQSAVKRIHHLDSGSSMSSIKSSLTSMSYNLEQEANSMETAIYDVGVDVMAKVLTYLRPLEAHAMLSMPLSKTFRSTFSTPQDLWRVLCLSEPFHARVDTTGNGSDDSMSSYPICKKLEVNHLVGRYRLLYSSFVKCVRYLDRIKEDASNGRTPSGVYDSDESSLHSFEDNTSLEDFFAKAQEMKRKERSASEDSGNNSGASQRSSDTSSHSGAVQYARLQGRKTNKKKEGKVKYSVSKLTNRLLGPVHSAGIAGNVGLPRSCAMYSVVNWMVAFADVAGIQLMCLKVLPDLLVDEQQRTSGQHAGLTDIVLRAMVLFPNMVDLHTAAFHTLVLLARPLGGKEGMLFHTAMVNASGIFNVGSSTGKSGIAIMLDSMKRFVDDEDLQAMSCWSMVNIALIPSQKVVLVRLGGISAANNAMIHHPHNAEVQFRALFALINLVIPSENLSENSVEANTIREQMNDMNQDSEIEMLNESIEQVTNLVVVAMKNFCSSDAILNRACLVLHNLSLNEMYHNVLLLTPNCYQMLEWCIGNYLHDNVLQQSARGTHQRLQLTLSRDSNLRESFTESLRVQHQLAVESARNEATAMAVEQPDV